MSAFNITGRTYKALLEFCGDNSLGHLSCLLTDGKGSIYATDKYVAMRWVLPTELYTTYLTDGSPHVLKYREGSGKITAAQKIRFGGNYSDFDFEYAGLFKKPFVALLYSRHNKKLQTFLFAYI